MRIIDNKRDLYDDYQHLYKDDTIVFDRRDSFVLSKEDFMRYLNCYRWNMREPEETYVLLQVHHTFWLLKVNSLENDVYGHCTKYNLDFYSKWNNYDSDDKLISLSTVSFNWLNKQAKNKTVKDRIDAINKRDYYTYHEFDCKTIRRDYKSRIKGEEKHIPILRETGIWQHIDPLDVYLALEEYFINQKAMSERREPIGMTDEDKVITHGFDDKSFRKESGKKREKK